MVVEVVSHAVSLEESKDSEILLAESFYLKNWDNKKYNCSGSLAFKSQRVAYESNQKLLHHC